MNATRVTEKIGIKGILLSQSETISMTIIGHVGSRLQSGTIGTMGFLWFWSPSVPGKRGRIIRILSTPKQNLHEYVGGKRGARHIHRFSSERWVALYLALMMKHESYHLPLVLRPPWIAGIQGLLPTWRMADSYAAVVDRRFQQERQRLP
jgi:hypothetical protein